MTTTETSSDSSPPDAQDQAAPAEAAPAPAGEAATTNGESTAPAQAASVSAEAESGEADAADEASAEGEGEGAATAAQGEAPQGEKKRRRRRRKKKPGAHAGAPGETAAGEAGDAAEPVEGAVAGGPGDEASADRPDRRPRPDKKKHVGPPRERPPVNGGDIVFGKIIEITDEAILIDIPGKAKAIFDRRELLLPEDDDAPRPAPVAPAAAADETATDTTGAEATAEVSPEAPGVEIATEPVPAATEAVPEPEPAVAAVEASPSEAPAQPAVPEAEAPMHREPKIPRVVLEVGADFIAVVHNDGARGGLVVLTHHPHRAERAKPVVEKAFEAKTPIEGLVTGVIKGGVEVDVDGLRAFAPGSHVDLRLGADLSHLVGKRLAFGVTQYAKRGRDVVLTRRAMLEDEAKKARAEALGRLKIGEELDGTVRSVVPFGAFIDVGGIEGLVPLQEMSHDRGDGPSDVFKAGAPTRVKVIKIDDKGKIWLSRKATIPDPWQQVAQKYAQGTKHTGKVARLQPFGAFIELEPAVDGLIHLADLSIKRIEGPGEVVKVGDSIDVVVSHVDPSNHKIALHPAPTGDAANETPQRVAPHKPVKAKVENIESGGLVVRILGVTGRNARGYITAQGTGTPRGTELRKAFKIGQEIEAKVVEMDPRRGEVKLSIKALSEEQERSAYQQYRQQLKAEARFTFGDLLAKKGPQN
jgi:small subunit ribosomal protein S1